jgi:hypothetical protein
VSEIAGHWLRVSTMSQDEASQEPDLDRWISQHGYKVGPTYRVHGLSAFHGKTDRPCLWSRRRAGLDDLGQEVRRKLGVQLARDERALIRRTIPVTASARPMIAIGRKSLSHPGG